MNGTALLVTAAIALCAAVTASGVSIGQTDTFEDGTTQGWIAGLLGQPHPAPPVNVASGGPAGANDNFLQLTSLGGAGPGSRLSTISFGSQWAGDYIAAGVSFISMDVRNLGSTDLSLRLSFSDPVAGPPSNIAFSSAAVFLPAGGGWTPIFFPIDLANLSGALGDVETALRNTTELRIYHSPSPNAPNPVSPISSAVAQIGIDNIQARAADARTPDTGSSALLLATAAGVIGLLRWRTTRVKYGLCLRQVAH
ncbi:MAG: hypothetical protein AB9869_30825 [Verrucomicrobiia bacterium]